MEGGNQHLKFINIILFVFFIIKSKNMLTIIDYNLGNIKSVINAFNYLGVSTKITNDKKIIKNSSKILLPGVGSFKKAMENIKKLELEEIINELVLIKKIPVLGICLGMQLLTQSSEEDGFTKGFEFIDGKISRFKSDLKLSIPHIGFNSVDNNEDNILFKNIENNSDFYFVHSYKLEYEQKKYNTGLTDYGERFISTFQKDNIFGVQFHPEKSQSNGLKLLKNFANL